MMDPIRRSLAALVAALCLALPGATRAEAPSRDWTEGYATARLELHEAASAGALLEVDDDGRLVLDGSAVPPHDRHGVELALRAVPGATGIVWRESGAPEREIGPGAAAVTTPDPGPDDGWVVLPARSLFESLAADPRWPRFSASYLSYHDDDELDAVGAVAFGGSLPLVQGALFGEGRWDFGVQAGVFSIFDLDSDSLDLVNSDFWVGLPIGARWGAFSLTLRPYHQSSHLGDEFLLRDRVERIDVSFEAVDLLASIDLWSWGRLYGGGGYLIDREPDELPERYVQAGIELISPRPWIGDSVRPLLAVDAQRRDDRWDETDYSARLGVQIENPDWPVRRMQIMAEYYRGRSPNGQFFERRIEYWGGGIHLHY